jgi:hypothetical protein
MFERTKSGLQNKKLFFGVDYVCYVEGGGGRRDAAPDVTFWNTVLSVLRPDLNVKISPRGGKPILQRIATHIVEQNVQDTLVAMDSDYDDFRSLKYQDRRVLYTFGYSWENDVFIEPNLRRALDTAVPKPAMGTPGGLLERGGVKAGQWDRLLVLGSGRGCLPWRAMPPFGASCLWKVTAVGKRRECLD